ncbi:hypothetical protein KIN20_007473 [Parelaphostrongylus tenuis]|uniref:Uncharacterized protein n=1 Tax=Parelaphostrongylus tenuis TaxID=148309 RepID=A0AAD5MVL6_PARTN|nr:hypothetical protein KIN20_007473 [Parelaphostrongylus tenuis]
MVVKRGEELVNIALTAEQNPACGIPSTVCDTILYGQISGNHTICELDRSEIPFGIGTETKSGKTDLRQIGDGALVILGEEFPPHDVRDVDSAITHAFFVWSLKWP